MRWLILLVLFILLLSLYFNTEPTKEFIGMVIANLEPLRANISAAIAP